MSQPATGPIPYRVIYSEYVQNELRRLLQAETARARGRQVLNAVRRIDWILRIYPQFGEPLQDLSVASESLWIGTVPPLVIRYVIDEDHHLVFVVAPFQLLPEAKGGTTS